MAVVRTVHCVADGPEIRHSKVQSAQVPMYPNLLFPSLCVHVCVRRGSRYMTVQIKPRGDDRTFYLAGYNGSSLSDPGPPTSVDCSTGVVYLPTGTGRGKHPSRPYPYNTHTDPLPPPATTFQNAPRLCFAPFCYCRFRCCTRQTDGLNNRISTPTRSIVETVTSRPQRLCVVAPSLANTPP